MSAAVLLRLGLSLSALPSLLAVEVPKYVEEKDLYNHWHSPGWLWATLAFVVVVVVVVIAFRYEKRYLEQNRPKKNIKLEE